MPINPVKVRLDASTACQLKCPTCPTAKGDVAKSIGSGFLKFDHFKKFLNDNPRVKKIELSNWGEIFLNPDLLKIMEYADLKKVALCCDVGANFNRVSDEVLEGLVKYRFRSITCAIDGASNETYAVYRRNGNFDQVLDNIRRLNQIKRIYRSKWPQLKWQFVVFGHNEHEIAQARTMARDLKMSFWVKLSWGDMHTPGEAFSPVNNKEIVRRQTGIGVADRQEYQEKYSDIYSQKFMCSQLWVEPQINFDGKVLGCCINYWGNYGNAFKDGLAGVLNNEKMNYARGMLKGEKEQRDDIPCAACTYYVSMKKRKAWMSERDIFLSKVIYKFRYWLQNDKYLFLLSCYFFAKRKLQSAVSINQ
jgi:MoaA/NifB/PqqE/SkfB family radical SAM enzyme